MAGPVPTYLTTQLAAQTAFTVPFGLLAIVTSAITAATTAGEFNTTVDCSLFTAEDVSNLRIYLDSQGYTVEFAKNSGEKSLLIDWGKFLDIPGNEVIVTQGTSPWIISGDVRVTDQLVPFNFDTVIMEPTGTNPTIILYKAGGLSGTTVATLTLTYDANLNVQTVTRT